MAFFRRRTADPVSFDHLYGSPVAEQVAAALAARDWRTLRAILNAVQHPDDRSYHLQQCADHQGLEMWVEQWVAAEPRSALPMTVAGIRTIYWAWEARSAKSAKNVTADQFRVFHHRLRRAETILRRAAELDHDDPQPWAWLVTVARGLQMGHGETWSLFREATARYRWHQAAHEAMLQQLCQKWGGSHELMHDFANRTVAEMPDGSMLGILAPQAQLEHWLRLDDPYDEQYVESPEAVATIRAAAVRSVWHPALQRRADRPRIHNAFALAFMHNLDWRSADGQFAAIGPYPTRTPWEYLDAKDTGRRFRECRSLTRDAAVAAEAAEQAERLAAQ